MAINPSEIRSKWNAIEQKYKVKTEEKLNRRYQTTYANANASKRKTQSTNMYTQTFTGEEQKKNATQQSVYATQS